MATIMDNLIIRLNNLTAGLTANSNRVDSEATSRANADEALSNRIDALETNKLDAIAEIQHLQTLIATERGRTDALVNQLTQLGVDAGI